MPVPRTGAQHVPIPRESANSRYVTLQLRDLRTNGRFLYTYKQVDDLTTSDKLNRKGTPVDICLTFCSVIASDFLFVA